MTKMKDILISENLSVGYGTNRKNQPIVILKDVNLNLREGELACLMGPNGIGKSTLIRTLAGLQSPLGGTVLLHGLAVHKQTSYERARQISVVLTDRVNAGNLNVYELIALGRYPFTNWIMKLDDADNQAISKAIEVTALSHILHQKLYQLSDGQLQKTMIARALAQDGKVMILDEPTAHLDLNNRVEIMRLLRNLAHNHGKSILIATHELDLALQLADKLILLLPGGKMAEGIPEDLVLNGQLDETFQMKGYNLKTGKAEFIPEKSVKVAVKAEGYTYLWTKNALERNGYEVVDVQGNFDVLINTFGNDTMPVWKVLSNESENSFHTLKDLIDYLNRL